MRIITGFFYKHRIDGFNNTQCGEFGLSQRFGVHHDNFGSESVGPTAPRRSAILSIILSLSVWSAASLAFAQPPSVDLSAPGRARIPSGDSSGWWSPARAEFQARPTLLVMASANTQSSERSAASGAGASNPSKDETVCDTPASTISDSSSGNCRPGPVQVASLVRPSNGLAEVAASDSKAGSKTANAAPSPYSLIAQLKKMPSGELYPGLFLSTVQTESMLQEQSLAKSTVADEQGTHFKPLAEVNLGGQRFPIFLYSPSASGPTQGR